jgi:hypothetical protein
VLTPDEAAQVFVDAAAYADDGRFHESCAVLRRESPLLKLTQELFGASDPELARGVDLADLVAVGAQFAKMEMRALFKELLPRLEYLERAGEPELSRTLFVGGLKHLPIRYRLRPAPE